MPKKVIGNLSAELTLDQTKYEEGLNKVRRSTQTFSQKAREDIDGLKQKFAPLAKGVAVVGAAFVAAGAAMADLAQKGLEADDHLAKTAATLGTTATELGGLHHAAQQSGVEIKQFDQAFQRFGKTVADAKQGLSTARYAFAQLGLSWKQMENLPMSKQLELVADKLKNVTSQTDKLQVVSNLFGQRAGPAMLNMLKGGSKAMQEQIDEAKKLGLVLSANQSRTTQAAADAEGRVKTAFKGLTMQLGAELAPAIKKGADELAHLTTAFTHELPILGVYINKILGVKRAVDQMSEADQKAELGINMAATTKLNSAISDQETRLARLNKIAERNPQYQKGMRKHLEDAVAEEKKQLAVLNKRDTELMKAMNSGEKPNTPGTNTSGSNLGNSNPFATAGKAHPGALGQHFSVNAYLSGMKQLTSAQNQQIQAWRTAAHPLQKYTDEFAALQKAVDEGAISQDVYKKNVELTAKAMTAAETKANKMSKATTALGKTATQLGATFTSAFENAIVGGQKASAVFQGLGKDIEKILLRVLVLDPLTKGLTAGIQSMQNGGTFGGGFKAGYFGHHAGGGTSYGLTEVGELGPEFIAPPGPVRVLRPETVANHMGGGGAQTVKMEIVNSGSGKQVDHATATMQGNTLVISAMMSDLKHNGPFTRNMQHVFGLNRKS